jgi:serine/threonine-protein kinase
LSVLRITFAAVSSSTIASNVVLAHLSRVLSSSTFRGADRSAAVLRFLVESAVRGDADRLKEYTVGVEALGRGASFDPRTDPIVRAEASRLRSRLERYYADEGQTDDLIIELPKGKYVPRFAARPVRSAETPMRPRWPKRRTIAWLMAGSAAMLGAFVVGAWVAKPSPASPGAPIMRLDVQLQSHGLIGSEVGTDVAVAPDGSGVVFVSTDSAGMPRLRAGRFDGSPSVDLPGTNGARGPFWSPDGRWVAFWARGQLKKVPRDGGSPVVLCDASDLLGGSWGEDGRLVMSLNSTGKLWRVPAAGGTPTPIIDLGAGGGAPHWPQILPDGKTILYTVIGAQGADRAAIEAVSLADTHRTVLVRGGTYGRFVPPHYLTYVNQGTLYAMRFDPKRMATSGSPVPIFDGVAYSSTFGYAQLSISDRGVAVYRRAPGQGQSIVAAIDSAGHATPLIDAPGRYTWPAISPDGRRLAVSTVESGQTSISIFDNLNDRAHRTVSVASAGPASAWMPDGRSLVLGGVQGLAWIPAEGGSPKMLVQTGSVSAPWSVARDGRRLAFGAMSPTTAFDIWTVPVTASSDGLRAGAPDAFLRSPFFETYPTFSPDGRWLAYTSNETGSWEIYVRAFPGNGKPVQVSRDGGRVPRWSREGRQLFFATDDRRIMVAAYQVRDGAFVSGLPRQWSPVRLADTGVLPGFDLFPDGRRAVALLPASGSDELETANHVTLMLNFLDELRRRVP